MAEGVGVGTLGWPWLAMEVGLIKRLAIRVQMVALWSVCQIAQIG